MRFIEFFFSGGGGRGRKEGIEAKAQNTQHSG